MRVRYSISGSEIVVSRGAEGHGFLIEFMIFFFTRRFISSDCRERTCIAYPMEDISPWIINERKGKPQKASCLVPFE